MNEKLKTLNIKKVFTFNIITTNKNRTAIAPTYIIIKNRAKNSTLNMNKIKQALQKVKIRNKTEWTTLSENITKTPVSKKRKVNNRCTFCI